MHLLRVCSPNLPIGGFSWSQGLEGAVGLQWIKNCKDLEAWLKDILSQSLAYNEIPIMGKAYSSNHEEAKALDHLLLSIKETKELKWESVQMGKSLHRLIKKLHPEMDQSSEDHLFEVNLSLLFHYLQIPLEIALHSYIWSLVENQVMAATRLISLGQYEAQGLLVELQQAVKQAVSFGLSLNDEDIGRSLPGLFMASSFHEEQYCRLFRS